MIDADFVRHLIGVALGLLLSVVVISVAVRALNYLRQRYP